MVAFCAPAAIVTKIGFWLIAIIIAGRAGVNGEGSDHDLGALGFDKAVLMWLADVQDCCGEGGSSKRWCLFLFGRRLRKTQTDT
ncbi:hypothetical protein [Pseudomonas sp. GM60]|uniref:hypothetical protein n=1 Tax=Pseudomonas sp. GM60 TaxID=1144334 RepID=UPI0002706DF2|nr:hypothetical protein [Pseudomonas sp. GM60]EJM83126.1 hypothetical protein PMI32_02383 [Pseudomonas sp. GM60]